MRSKRGAVSLVRSSRAASSGAGRPAACYSFRPRHGFVVALDIQRDETSITAATISGKVIHTSITPLVQRSRQERLEELCDHVLDVVRSLEADHGKAVCGFASTTGIVDGQGVILRSYSVPQWQDLPLARELSERTGIPFRIDNDIKQKAAANAKALGLDLSAITRMLLTQLAAKAELPEGLARPNAETLAAVADLERNGGTRYETVEDLMRDLGW